MTSRLIAIRNGETALAQRPRDMTALRRQAADIKHDNGVEARYISAANLSAHSMMEPFHGTMTIPIGVALNPRKYTNGLLGIAQSAGPKSLHTARSPDWKNTRRSA